MTNKPADILKELHKEVERFTNDGELKNYLDFTGKFINRSFNNQMLIYMAKPEATYVKGYKQWIDELKRIPVACTDCRSISNKACECVERQAPTRIVQLAPMIKKTEVDGKEKENLFFRSVYVFDISDTEPMEGAKDIPTIVNNLEVDIDNAAEVEAMFTKLIQDNGFNFRYDTWGDADLGGWCDPVKKEIVVAEDRPKAQQIRTMIHEIAHMFAHVSQDDFNSKKPRDLVEVEAESIAYTVSKMIGLDASAYSVGYVGIWNSRGDDNLKKSMETVIKTAQKIIELLEKEETDGLKENLLSNQGVIKLNV